MPREDRRPHGVLKKASKLYHYGPKDVDLELEGLKTPYTLKDPEVLEKYRGLAAGVLRRPERDVRTSDIRSVLRKERGPGALRMSSMLLHPVGAEDDEERRAYAKRKRLYEIDYDRARRAGLVTGTHIVEESPRSQRSVPPARLLSELQASKGFERTSPRLLFQGRPHAFVTLKGGHLPGEYLREKKASEQVYHGSPRRLKRFDLRDEHEDPRVPAAVFASPSEPFALAYSGRKWGDRDINQSTRGGNKSRQMILREMRPGAFEDVYGGKKGYMYELDRDTFQELPGRRTRSEVVSFQPVKPRSVRTIPDVLDELKKTPGVVLHPYDPKHPETRTAVRRKVKRMREMDDGGARYKKWYFETAPPEMKQMFHEEEEKLAFYNGFFRETEKLAYGVGSHKDLTNQALDNLEAKKGIRFTPAQRGRLLKANAGTDYENVRTLFMSPKTKPFHYHQGEEKVSKGLIKSHMDMAVAAKNTDAALDALGIALHTQQDRWAHSTHGIKPGMGAMLKHTFKRVDNPKKWPNEAKRAVKDSERLIADFSKRRPKRLGKVTKAPRYFVARLGAADGK